MFYDTAFKYQRYSKLEWKQESGRRLEYKTTREPLLFLSTTGMDEDYFINVKKYAVIIG